MTVYVVISGGVGIVVGLATLGFKVMQTVGQKITKLKPVHGFKIGGSFDQSECAVDPGNR